ncbi:MAG: superoxide dismutase [Spirochaetes bacterium]|nr:superoxide dismutase [Spirochaetota bacterium]MBU0955148.1 superoxide dismutase [Spirochaetota bacterium]
MQYLVTTFDNGNIDWSLHSELLRREALHVWGLYMQGVIRNIWFTEGMDALLILETGEQGLAKAILNEFPLVKAGCIKYTLTRLLPYSGWERLFEEPQGKDAGK